MGSSCFPIACGDSDCREWLERNLARCWPTLTHRAMTFLGEDFGRSGDLTVLAPLVQQQNLTRRTPFIVELRNVPFRQQEQIVFYLLDKLPRFTGGVFRRHAETDSTSPRSPCSATGHCASSK